MPDTGSRILLPYYQSVTQFLDQSGFQTFHTKCEHTIKKNEYSLLLSEQTILGNIMRFLLKGGGGRIMGVKRECSVVTALTGPGFSSQELHQEVHSSL